jgi:hypothetical protein
VFQRLATAYGSQWTSKWKGIDLSEIYQDWADDLGDFSVAAIGYGVEIARRQEQPPNLGEFMQLCRDYKPQDNLLKISRKLTPEQIEANRRRIRAIAEMYGMSKRMDV